MAWRVNTQAENVLLIVILRVNTYHLNQMLAMIGVKVEMEMLQFLTMSQHNPAEVSSGTGPEVQALEGKSFEDKQKHLPPAKLKPQSRFQKWTNESVNF